jgi:hypothetical protein
MVKLALADNTRLTSRKMSTKAGRPNFASLGK